MRVLITGVAGFIGSAVAKQMLQHQHEVIGIDNFNDYYPVSLKKDRVKTIIAQHDASKFSLLEIDICDKDKITQLFTQNTFDMVVHLAAQAGVRYSLDNPHAYFDSNLLGFGTILEACRQHNVAHLLYASSSSVYGENKTFPFSEKDMVDGPVSLYAATKKANELMAHSYSHLYQMHCTGLRFFTVYGPWGRPDMAPFRFAQRMLSNEEIPVYNQGNMLRDFTFIDDIVNGVVRICETPLKKPYYRIYNIGRSEPVKLLDFIETLAQYLQVEPKLALLPMQDGDVPRTLADTSALQRDFDYQPSISISEGLRRFASWYLSYYD